jgi:hypothetical protein
VTKYIKTPDELLDQLKQQIILLNKHASLFDKGYEYEALNLATSIRVIVYDSMSSRSLLTHLSCKNIKFYDSSLPVAYKNIPSHYGLLRYRMSTQNGITYYAPLDRIDHPGSKNRKIDFNDWWYGIVVIDKYNRKFTRHDLVCEVANTDGGAHVDDKLNIDYAELSRSNVSGWKVFKNGIESDFSNRAVFPSIRQITLELLKTLKDAFPKLFHDIRIRRS